MNILKEVVVAAEGILKEAGLETKITPDDVFESKLHVVVRKLYQEYGRPSTRLGMMKIWKEFRKEERALWSRVRGGSTRNQDRISLKSFCKYYNAVTQAIDLELEEGN